MEGGKSEMTTVSRHHFGDDSDQPDFSISIIEVLENMRSVIELNKLQCNVLGLTWRVWDASVFSLHPKFILGADVLYDAKAFDDLFATVTYLLQKSPGSVFITTYHNRRWGLKCAKLLDAFSFMPSSKASGLSETFNWQRLFCPVNGAEIMVLHFVIYGNATTLNCVHALLLKFCCSKLSSPFDIIVNLLHIL